MTDDMDILRRWAMLKLGSSDADALDAASEASYTLKGGSNEGNDAPIYVLDTWRSQVGSRRAPS